MATVEKRGNSWRLIAYLGYDELGNQIKRRITIPIEGVSKAEAKRLASKFESECLRKGYVDDKKMTLSEFVDYWKKEYALQEDTYSPKTLERNEQLLGRILPALGHIPIKKLKPTHIMEFYNNLREPGMRKDKDKDGKLSPRTIQMHHKLLSSILGKAFKWKFIKENPCQFVDAPKSKSKTIAIYTEDTLLHFLRLLIEEAKTKYILFFLLAFTTGLRRGELLALKWDAIDMEKGVLNVNQNAIVVKGEGIIYKDPKTEKSAGAISIAPQIIPLLKLQMFEQGIFKAKSKKQWPGKDSPAFNLVFTTENGNAMYPSTVNKWLTTFLERHNLPRISPHSFRHMSVTYAIDRGFDLKAVSDRTRHSQLSTTTDIYGHVLPQKDRAIAKSLGDIITQAQEEKPKQLTKDDTLLQ